MSHLAIYLLALAALSPARPALAALHAGGGLQDLAAYPKYQVEFLNDLPLAQSDADAIRQRGLTHEDEFKDLHPRALGTIDGADGEEGGEEEHPTEVSEPNAKDRITLMPMLYTQPGTDYGPHSYLCAMPSANTTASQTAGLDEPLDEPEPDAEASWRALSHLNGQCLYLRLPQSWFTYAYCHNKDIRQFRELPVPHPHHEGFVPKEDPEYDAYTLGVAHPKRSRKGKAQRKNELQRSTANSGPDDLPPEQTATFGQSHASRYLVQRWTDGTRCDLTGKPREIEVQVYCSMTGTDMIYMVNEVAICQYVIVIHSPHLCSLPGFRPTTAQDIKPAPIRCREVVSDEEFAEWEERKDERADERKRLRLGEKENQDDKERPVLDARLASKEADPELKIEGLGGIREEDIKAILEAAFGGIAGRKEEEARSGEDRAEDEDGAAEGDARDPQEELYVVGWTEDTDGNRVPVDVESVPPTEGESRRAFLERLHALIEKELKDASEGKEKTGSAEKGTAASSPDDAAQPRDEL